MVTRKTTLDGAGLLRLKLVSDLNSSATEPTALVFAEVTEPFYDSDHQLLYPVGSRLEGRVTNAEASRWLHKNAKLIFEFSSVTVPGGSAHSLHATLDRLEVSGDQDIKVSREGDLHAQFSHLAQGAALAGFFGPALAQSDPSVNKTAFKRRGLGFNGFGLIGTGAAQASAGSALGFGYFGAAKGFYGALIARGSNVVISANTPIALRIN